MQGGFVVDVEAGAGHEGDAVFAGEFDRAHVVGFDFELGLAGDFAQAFEVGFAFEQHLGGKDDFLAAVGEVLGKAEPVIETHFLAAGADGFAQIDGVERAVEHLDVEFEQGFFLPEELDGGEGEFHGCSFVFLSFQTAWRLPENRLGKAGNVFPVYGLQYNDGFVL